MPRPYPPNEIALIVRMHRAGATYRTITNACNRRTLGSVCRQIDELIRLRVLEPRRHHRLVAPTRAFAEVCAAFPVVALDAR